MRKIIPLLVVLATLATISEAQVNGYYRQPDIHGENVVFNSEGDLWLVASTGGRAQRLTSHAGQEYGPTISPDGKTIAFSASYEGARDTYVMPIGGGSPRRISWIGASPVGWTADGKIIARTSRFAGVPDTRLVLIDVQSGDVEQIPLSQAAEGAVTEDGTLYFARMGRQGSNSRFYKGGTSQKLWKFKSGDEEATPLTTDYPGGSRQPVIMNDGLVYFLSDRQGAMNIWSMDQDGGSLRQHTTLTDWDIQELAGDGESLVYRLGADLWTFAPGSGNPRKLDIWLVTDSERSLVDWETEPWNYMSDTAVSDDGKTVALVSRGELFTAPVGPGRLVHVSRDSGVRYRNVLFTADSTHVFGLSDKSGELEWWRAPINGVGSAEQISDGPGMLRLDGTPSPDGKYILHSSRDNGLWLVDIEGRSTELIASDPIRTGRAWSPDSRYVAFTKGTPNLMSAIFVYDTRTGNTEQLTSDRFMDSYPVFSANGSWLYFVSTRTWNSSVGSPWGERAPQPHFEDRAKIYAVPLRAEVTFPFAEPNELVAEITGDTAADSSGIRWDLGHLLRELPLPAGSYSSLMTNEKRLFYRTSGNLMALDFKQDAKAIRVLEGASAQLSGNGKHLLVRKDSKLYVISAGSGKDAKLEESKEVALSDWKFSVNKRDEWRQIYNDAWRLHRDYFWDPNMLGVDWEAMRDKYAPLVDRLGSREALADLQGMLVSELSLLHSNARGGDTQQGDDSVSPGALGGVFVRDPDTGGFKLEHIYVADPDLPGQWSPLVHPDVQMAKGDIILSVNGVPTSTAVSIEQLLMDQAGKQVFLTVRNVGGSTRDVVLTPMTSRAERNLRYHEWEHTRRLQTDEKSNGEIGYVHLRAMGRADIGQWTREFYSQTNRQGLIIDVRHNNGGNIDSWVLSQLLRRAWAYFKERSDVPAAPNMQYSFSGHMVVLVDERTASDGEAFADGFRRLGLGKAIGVRTWGGEVWLSSSNRQVDGGVVRASETGVYGLDGTWLIEGWGFVPDIEVDNLPHATFNGQDAQLEAAIAHLEELIRVDPRTAPAPPAYPVLIPGAGFPTPWKN